jgi:twitching motility protein PilI
MLRTSTETSNRDLTKPDTGTRRTRLREFQSQLVARMQAATSGPPSQSSQLGVMIGESRWLLNLQEAGEIISVGSITKVPLTQSWFLGLTNVRGNLISVIDLAHFRGEAPTRIDKESRIVAFSPSLSFNSGLLVSRVMGLRSLVEMKPQQRPDSMAAPAPWAERQYLDRESKLWTELDLDLILQDPRFLHVGL